MDFLGIVNVIVPIFALIGLGYLARRTNLMVEGADAVLSNYVYWFAFPALLVLRLAQTPFSSFFDLNLVLGYSLPLVVIALAIILFARRADPGRRGIMVLTTVFGNVAYIGVPFNTLAFGPEAGTVVIMTLALTTFWAIGLGQGTQDIHAAIKRLATNPLILAIIAGLACSALNFNLPIAASRTLELLAGTAGPTALFALGVFLVGKHLRHEVRPAAFLSAAKLLLLPILTALTLKFIFPVEPTKFAVAVSQAAMPMAATNFVFAKKWNTDPELVGGAILFSTVVSIISLSILLIILA